MSKRVLCKVILYLSIYSISAVVVYVSDISEIIQHFALWWEAEFDVIPNPVVRGKVMPLITGIVIIVASYLWNEFCNWVLRTFDRKDM